MVETLFSAFSCGFLLVGKQRYFLWEGDSFLYRNSQFVGMGSHSNWDSYRGEGLHEIREIKIMKRHMTSVDRQ